MVINSWFATTLLFKLGGAARLVDETMQFFFAEEFSSQRGDSFVFVNQHGRRDVSSRPLPGSRNDLYNYVLF